MRLSPAPFPLYLELEYDADDAQWDSPPLIQSTLPRTALFVYVTLAVTFVSYARFCYLVINDITEYLGIACFTVRKKDRSGEWVGAAEVNGGKNQ